MKKSAASNFVLACASILAGFAILEILTRVFVGAPWPEQLPVIRYRPDPDVGWLMVPNDFHYTYTFPVQLNSIGFRGPEVSAKLENEYRILVIGDSMVYGQGLADRHLMTNRLQTILAQRRPACRVRVINLGIKVFQTNQELALLKKIGLNLKPDLVILFFYINDFDSTSISGIYSSATNVDWYMSDLRGKAEGKALAAWRFRQLLRHSALVARAYNAYKAYRGRNTTENRLLRGEDNAEIEKKIAEIGGYIHEFSEMSKTHAFAFDLVAIPAAAQIDHRYPAARYPSMLLEFVYRDGFPFLDLLPAFDSDYQVTKKRHQIPFDGHFDAGGNEIMADAVAEFLTSHGSGCLAIVPSRHR
jgi:lysophospholipase L1-like esterase